MVEVIEWTDQNGDPITTGWNVSIVPVSPGKQYIGVTSLIDDCRSVDDIGTTSILIYADYAYAGKDIVSDDVDATPGECGKSIVTLSAYDNYLSAFENDAKGAWDSSITTHVLSTYPGSWVGTTKEGTWSILLGDEINNCAGTPAVYSFGNVNDPNSTFTGEPGTYKLTWTIPPQPGETVGCSSTVNVTITTCDNLNFDGLNDHIFFTKDDYNLPNQNFSMEAWIKPNDVSGTKTIISKRAASIATGSGYDLSIKNGIISFNWGAGGNIVSPNSIGTTRWYHIVVTFNGGTYKLYIDGIEVASKTGQALLTTDFDCLVGAMDYSAIVDEDPVNFYDGYMQELRIWNKALTPEQLHQMMNQKIHDNSGAVQGDIVPIDINGLSWADLAGYYHMDILCGQIMPTAGTISGRLKNIFTDQPLTAPIPYTSRVDGQNWDTDNTWTEFDVWDVPNSLGVDGNTPIDWNIVETTHNINANRDITLLGLISQSGKLTIEGSTGTDGTGSGQGLWITHYLKLNGVIDLEGESQLLQKRCGTSYDSNGFLITTQFSESIFEETSSGYLERDQQGQKNSFNYNYWSSPVSPQNSTANNLPYSVGSVLKYGTLLNNQVPITFGDGAYFADGTNSGSIKISNRWIWSYNGVIQNNDWDNYYQWIYIGSTRPLKAGEGFTMKGTGGTATVTTMQNYVFVGKPHSGTILYGTPPEGLGLAPNGWYLIGNPYPSALDADEFILDNIKATIDGKAGRNISANIFNGALYFWDHFRITDNHILAQYAGGYATYTLIGGVVAMANTPLTVNDGVSSNNIDKKPERYIPVGQAFFIEATSDPSLSLVVEGGPIVLKNSQRTFMPEVSGTSVFMKGVNAKGTTTTSAKYVDSRPKIRLQFDSPLGYHRGLLVGVDERTSNKFDIGFDAPLNEDNKEDMFWQLEKGKLVIQGVNNFNEDQELPLGLKISKAGLARIKIDELENMDEDIILFIKDKFTGKTHNISYQPFEIELEPGTYLDRFSLIFRIFNLMEDDVASGILLVEPLIEDNNYHVFMNNAIEELQIKNNGTDEIRSVALYNNLGQTMRIWNTELNRRIISLPVKLATGVYIVQINTINGTINKRIIIE